jgi:hypothetical protein
VNSEKTYSWIFLTIALASERSPAKIREISAVADGINHAVPTQQEIQFSLMFLSCMLLVEKKIGNRYQLTRKGKQLYEEAGSTLFDIWKYIEKEFSSPK